MNKTTATKIIETTVTRGQLWEAQGGQLSVGRAESVWVECPTSYRADRITAQDIIIDTQIRTLTSAEIEAQS